MQDLDEKRCLVTRFAKETGSFIKVPKTDVKVQEDSELDTLSDAVKKVTFVPNLSEVPFPTQLMNEFTRMKRKNRENQAL